MANDQATLADQDPEVQAAGAAAPEPSMADTMRATLEKIRGDEASTGEEGGTAAQERARAADGKFAKKDETNTAATTTPAPQAQATAAPAAPGTVDPAAQAAGTTPAPAAGTEVVAPSSWTGPAKAEFAKASPIIQQEVLRREQQMHNGIAQYKDAANYGQTIHKAIQPYSATIGQLGITPDVAIGQLFKADHTMRHGAPHEQVAMVQQMVAAYQMDPVSIIHAMAQLGKIDLNQGIPAPQAADPNLHALRTQNLTAQQELQATRQELQQHRQQQEAMETAALNSEIAAAKQTCPHFDNLRNEMALLIQAAGQNGENLSLVNAYERAVWAHPTYRAEMLAEQQAEQAKKDAEQRAAETARLAAVAATAKAAASTNVAKRGTLQAQGVAGSMLDTAREALERIRSQ